MTGSGQSITQRDRAASAVGYLLKSHDAKAEGLYVFPESDTGAKQTYGVTLDLGWAKRIIASRCYREDALGVAYAVGAALDCEVIELP